MPRRRYAEVQPWMLFALPLAIAVPIVAAILLGGPIVGFPVAVLVAIVVVAAAIRMQPRPQRTAAPPAAPNGGWRAAAAARFAVAATIAVAGIVVGLAASGTASIVGWGVMAIGITLAVSFAFLEIGYSEDRARAAERRRQRRVPPSGRGSSHAR